MVTWAERVWSFRWNRALNLGGIMVLCWVELWCYVICNDGVMLYGMMLLCWVE